MRVFLFIVSFSIYAAFVTFSDNNTVPNRNDRNLHQVELIRDSSTAQDSITFLAPEQKKRTRYKFEINLDDFHRSLFVKQKIIWFNNSSDTLESIAINMFPKAYSDNESHYAIAEENSEMKISRFEIEDIIVNGIPHELIKTKAYNGENSVSTFQLNLLKPAAPNDSMTLTFAYDLKLPENSGRLGKAADESFYSILDWYPEVAVYSDSIWYSTYLHPYAGKFQTFSDFELKIELPDSFNVISSGITLTLDSLNNRKQVLAKAENLKEFNWFVINPNNYRVRNAGTNSIKVRSYLHPAKEYLFTRIDSTVRITAQYLKDFFGVIPFENLSIIDLPKTIRLNISSIKDVVLIRPPLFSPSDVHITEKQIIKAIVEQYMAYSIASNEFESKWIVDGMVEFLTDKICAEILKEEFVTFDLARYYPIYGLNFLMYREIPIVYNLAAIVKTRSSDSYQKYYSDLYNDPVLTKTYFFEDREKYELLSKAKANLILLLIDKNTDSEFFSEQIKSMFNSYSGKFLIEQDYFNYIDPDAKYSSLYSGTEIFDYKIESVQVDSSNYKVRVLRLGDGIQPIAVSLITQTDTLIQHHSGENRVIDFDFESKDQAIAATVDLETKNVLDINFANNSYTINEQFESSISLAVRFFFWIQNALMIIGSIG
ncbi:MAG: hypothetical protein K9G44_03965 [Melioribacteraceae bacterium]|nr:hypothetical protein [Melioribacteraceae bacterium]